MSANEQQFGGTHYKQYQIQPWDYIVSNNLGYLEGSAIKYISRWKDKGGIQDIHKAIHFLEKLIEVEEEKQKLAQTPKGLGEYSEVLDGQIKFYRNPR